MPKRVRKSRAGLKHWKKLVTALKLMNFVATNVKIYPPTHSEVRSVVAKLRETLQPVFADSDDIGYGFMDELLYIEGAMSIEETQNNEDLVEVFTKCRIKYVTLTKDVSEEELLGFFVAMNDTAQSAEPKPVTDLLAEQAIRTINIVESEADDEAGKGRQGRRRTLLDWYDKVLDIVTAVQEDLRKNPDADLRPIYHVVDDMMATMRTKGYEPFLLLPGMTRELHPHHGHAINTAIYCGALGELYGLNSGQIQTLCVGAFLHDLGRCIIPVEWAADAAPLTLFERAVVNQHPSWSFLLLTRHKELPPAIALLSAYHHARPAASKKTGRYFPDILQKILHTADAFDLAQFSDHFYWKRRPSRRMLLSMLRRRGVWYDAPLVKVLTQMVGLYPVGTPLELNDGRKGIVVRSDPASVARPRLYMYEADVDKPELAPGEEEPDPEILDLMDLTEDELGYKYEVEHVLSAGSEINVVQLLDRRREHLLGHKL
jgi:HD-GYP domain-containing protein (c-di-GMP phosphodiesterase class II)